MEPLFKSAPSGQAVSSWTGRWAQLLGLFFVIDGIWGLTSPVTFGVFATNTTHAVVHLALGAVGLWLGTRAQGRAHRLQGDTSAVRSFVAAVGVLLLLVGIGRFIPGVSDVVIRALNVNPAVAVLNIILGSISLVAAALTGRRHLTDVGQYARVAVPRPPQVARLSRT